MPDEFRIWREKIEAVEAKKKLGMQSAPGASSSGGGLDQTAKGSSLSSTVDNANPLLTRSQPHRKGEQDVAAEAPLVFNSISEAQEAFKGLLAAKGVSTTAKMKEVQDLCSSDPRWEALRNQGDKKQCLAEYQVSIILMFTLIGVELT